MNGKLFLKIVLFSGQVPLTKTNKPANGSQNQLGLEYGRPARKRNLRLQKPKPEKLAEKSKAGQTSPEDSVVSNEPETTEKKEILDIENFAMHSNWDKTSKGQKMLNLLNHEHGNSKKYPILDLPRVTAELRQQFYASTPKKLQANICPQNSPAVEAPNDIDFDSVPTCIRNAKQEQEMPHKSMFGPNQHQDINPRRKQAVMKHNSSKHAGICSINAQLGESGSNPSKNLKSTKAKSSLIRNTTDSKRRYAPCVPRLDLDRSCSHSAQPVLLQTNTLSQFNESLWQLLSNSHQPENPKGKFCELPNAE